LDNQTGALEFVSQALLVDRFQKPGAQGFVNLNGAMDDLLGDLFEFHLSIKKRLDR
jgi:hypothetical protein